MPLFARSLLAGIAAVSLATTALAEVTVDAGYPGANIIVERQDANTVYLRQDLRDTTGWWFYWSFEATGGAGETVNFQFTDGNVIGTRGPAISLDGGITWSWLGTEAVETVQGGVAFTYILSDAAPSVRFAFAPPYLASDLEPFLARHAQHPNLAVETLCESEKGRAVERLRLGRLSGTPDYRILLTARHHACESMASFVLEGLMGAMLGNSADAAWFNEHAEALVIPFVDKDGVEDGDQGKNRAPRDHGRDYTGESLYNSTRAIREYVPDWSGGRLRFTLDIHCTHIRGGDNERIYQVGHVDPAIWAEQQRFAHFLENVPKPPLPYAASNDLRSGESWNKASNYTGGAPIFHWTAGLEGVKCGSAIEIPYANAGEVTVTPDNARAFGAAMLPAIRGWLETSAR